MLAAALAKKAFITGISGQDGSYLAEVLLENGYEEHGMVRRHSNNSRPRLDAVKARKDLPQDKLHIHYGDLADGSCLVRLLTTIQPDEVYNLGAQSHVRVSFDCPDYTAEVSGVGAVCLLEALRALEFRPRFYQASTSEMFGGGGTHVPQHEKTPFAPRSPYACAKVFAYWATVNYREAYKLHGSNGILFNHESPWRGEAFVIRKITLNAAKIKLGLEKRLALGNLDARRDWGYAKEYVEAMWLMLQQQTGDDYVIAMGETHAIRDCLEVAFSALGLRWEDYVDFDQNYTRPTEVDLLVGDGTKAKTKLGCEPKVRFKELIELMVDADMRLLRDQACSTPILSY